VLLVYVVVSTLWIVLGDALLHRSAVGVRQSLGWHTLKGLAFAAFSAGALAWVGAQRDRAEKRRLRKERELRERDSLYRAVFEGSVVVKLLVDPRGGGVIEANDAAARFYGYSREELKNMNIASLFVARDDPGDELLKHAAEGTTLFEAEHQLADGGVRDVSYRVGLLEMNGREVLYLIVQDVTERREARQELERRARQQAALARLGQGALENPEPSRVIRQGVEAVRETLGVRFVNVLYRRPDRMSFVLESGLGWPAGVVEAYETPNDPGGMAGFVLRSDEPVISSDLAGEVRFEPPRLLLEQGVVSSAAVRIDHGRETFGILSAHATVPRDYDCTDVAFMEGIANVLAAAIRQRRYEDALRESNERLVKAYDATIEGWAQALDLKDHETEGHSRRVTNLSVAVGRALGLDKLALVALRRGALLHDIGKMGVPDAILHKPGPLSEEEWVIMRSHPVLAKKLLEGIAFLRDALDVPYSHHEKWDGSGYPLGLKGEEIPLSARVFAVVDVFDALTSNRPYRKAWSEEKALAHIQESAGTHFDPQVVEAFLRLEAGERGAGVGM